MFNLEDIEIDEDAAKSAKIEQLSKEIATLRAQLNVPASIRGTIGGAAIGAGLGMGAVGTLALGILGYNMSKDKTMSDEQRNAIEMKLRQKAQDLLRLQRDEEIEDATLARTTPAQDGIADVLRHSPRTLTKARGMSTLDLYQQAMTRQHSEAGLQVVAAHVGQVPRVEQLSGRRLVARTLQTSVQDGQQTAR